MPETTTYTVTGMSCDHCVRAVEAELSGVVGVSRVDVDLASGQVAVTSDGPVVDRAVRDAVVEAGYEVVS